MADDFTCRLTTFSTSVPTARTHTLPIQKSYVVPALRNAPRNGFEQARDAFSSMVGGLDRTSISAVGTTIRRSTG